MGPYLERAVAAFKQFPVPALAAYVVTLPKGSTLHDKGPRMFDHNAVTTARCYMDADTVVLGRLDHGSRWPSASAGAAQCVNSVAASTTGHTRRHRVKTACAVFTDAARPVFDEGKNASRRARFEPRFVRDGQVMVVARATTVVLPGDAADRTAAVRAADTTGILRRRITTRSAVRLKVWHNYAEVPRWCMR